MSRTYNCEKHGEITSRKVLLWNGLQSDKRWCAYCYEDMMDKYCGNIVLIKSEEKEE